MVPHQAMVSIAKVSVAVSRVLHREAGIGYFIPFFDDRVGTSLKAASLAMT
jgi:hypothetical protein